MENIQRSIRRWIIFFMIMLFLSGLTAIPIESGLELISGFFPLDSKMGNWLDKVYDGIHRMSKDYPFLAYGYDWLAFAHFVLAILFIGPLKQPVRNKWVIEFGMIACVLIIPFAIVAGHYRDIPFWWRLVDCSFGIAGIIPLFICLKKINQLEKIKPYN